MAFRTRVWSAGKLLLLSGALLATYLLFAAAAVRVALKAREVQVPDLTNRTANEATAAAADVGLSVRLDEVRRPDSRIPAGRVIAQEPPPGSMSRQQRSVRVWLSAGQRAAVVPSFVGDAERSAQMRISKDGLEIAALSEIRSESFPADVVVAQEPPPNSAGSRVAILVNRGEQASNYVMPDLIGVNGERAAEVLRRRGFRAAVVGASPYPGVTPGVVIRQNPQAGFQIAPGESISIEVSR
ncbi:MAG: PASTA domain-containing protein [Vicinamibacterales bacterium]